MGVVKQAISRAHRAVLRETPTEATFYQLTYDAAEDAFDGTAQYTVAATARVKVIFEPEVRENEPVETYTTKRGVVSVSRASLSWIPTEADRVAIGGVTYNIIDCRDVAGAVTVLRIAGPGAAIEVSGADVTAPRLSSIVLTGDVGTFTYSATANEAAYHRLRYRRPPLTGTWSTGSYSVGTATSITGTGPALDAGTYEVQMQAKDAAGNESAWFDGGNVVVAGVPT